MGEPNETIESGDDRVRLERVVRRYVDTRGEMIRAGDVLFNSHDRDGYHTVLEGEDGELFLGDLDSPLWRYAPEKWWTISRPPLNA